jgi:DNA (cytosine-5)-methyltransferase 1
LIVNSENNAEIKLKMLDLFSGIGGFSLAASWAGIETIAFCEIDPFCQKALKKYWSDVPIYPDITKLRGDEIGTVDIIAGGFPCQPFSVAGKRRGTKDDRFLWPEMFRIIQEVKPTWIVGENVAGFINMGLDDCISDLESEGYEVQAFIIPACTVNAPHRRDRIWIVGNSKEYNGRLLHQYEQPGEANTDITRADCHAPDTDRFNGDDAGHGAGEVSQQQKAEIHRGEATSDLQYKGLEGLWRKCESRKSKQTWPFGWPDWDEPWLEAATRLCRVDDGLPRRVDRVNRLKALGNSIVPQVAYQIFKAIVEVENNVD